MRLYALLQYNAPLYILFPYFSANAKYVKIKFGM